MQLTDFVRIVDDICGEMKLRYFVSGSVASSYYGEFRSTGDVDIVVALSPRDVSGFCKRFEQPEWYVSEEAARGAITSGGMFNIIHVPSGLKIDIMTSRERPQDQLRLDRRRQVTLETGAPLWFASPEDVILSKLEFFREGKSEKHVRDIGGILKAAEQTLDMAYLDHWAHRLGVHSEWRTIKDRLSLP